MSANIYYVYILSREDGTPFYVGFGKGNRWLDHERSCKSKERDSHRSRIIRGMLESGVSIPKVKLAEGLTRDEAVALEIRTIAEIGREPLGPLVNQTAGGDGQRDMTQELRDRISAKISAGLVGNARRAGIPHSEETKAKIGAKIRGRVPAGMSDRLKGNTYGNLNKGKPKSPETRQKMKEAALRRVAEGRHHVKVGHVLSPDTKAKIVASLTLRNKSAESRAKVSAALKGHAVSEETRLKMKAGQVARRVREAKA